MIRRQVVIPVSPEQLWDALTDPAQVAGWFGGRIEWELREGGPADFCGDDGSERDGRVEAVRIGRHLRFRWWPADNSEAGDADPADPDTAGGGGGDVSGTSEVSYVLEPDGDGTRLTIQERQVIAPPISPQASARACAQPAPWTVWDDRLVGVWAGLVAPVAWLVRG